MPINKLKTALPPKVQKVFDAYPQSIRLEMRILRELIIDVGRSIEGVGQIEETLKWGEPSYLTSESKTGTTIRIDWKPTNPNFFAMYFSCQTDLVKRFRREFPDVLQFEGNRAVLVSIDQPIPVGPLSKCISAALTYHRDK